MKKSGYGQAKILTKEECDRLLEKGFLSNKHKALFATLLYTGCRVSEALQLRDCYVDLEGGTITFRRDTTKGKLGTRTIPVHPRLEKYLGKVIMLMPRRDDESYFFDGNHFPPGSPYGHLSRHSADRILRNACKRCGIKGVSTHSFRRTALTLMSNSGIPLWHIQEVSGHRDLGSLQRYLEVQPDQVIAAVGAISF